MLKVIDGQIRILPDEAPTQGGEAATQARREELSAAPILPATPAVEERPDHDA